MMCFIRLDIYDTLLLYWYINCVKVDKSYRITLLVYLVLKKENIIIVQYQNKYQILFNVYSYLTNYLIATPV